MERKITLLFPGQGSQYVGMGKNLKDHSLFEAANEVLGKDLKALCFEGPEEELKATENTQPAILTHSVATFKQIEPILEKLNFTIERVLGHSVGEYAALTVAGALNFSDAVKAVQLRGKYMQEAVPAGKGKMYALLKVPGEKIIEACKAVSSDDEKVSPANFNEPGQTVISGHAKACDDAVRWLEENFEGKMRAVELAVSAPFHCDLMTPASEKLAEHLKSLEFKNLTTPYIANIDSLEYGVETDPGKIRENLVDQVCGSVLWSQSIDKLSDGTLCLEVGPGKVLMGLVRKINREVKVLPLDNPDNLENLEEKLQELLG